jgi:hypothetical protein
MAMRMYRVLFEHNQAVAANQIDFSNSVSIKIEHPDGYNSVKWVIVYADDEEESMRVANKIVRGMSNHNERTGTSD